MNKSVIFAGLLFITLSVAAYVFLVKEPNVVQTQEAQESGTSSGATLVSKSQVESNIASKLTTMTYQPNFLPITTNSEGKRLEYQFGTFDPVINLGDVSTEEPNITSPVQMLSLYYRFLAKADIASAAKLSTDPAKTIATLTAYRERLGEDAFKKKYSEAISSSPSMSVSSVAKVGNDNYIVFLKTESYTGANVLVKSGTSYVLVEDPSGLPQDVQDVLSYLTKKFNP